MASLFAGAVNIRHPSSLSFLAALSLLRLGTLVKDAEARVISCYARCHGLHGGFEIFVGRIDE